MFDEPDDIPAFHLSILHAGLERAEFEYHRAKENGVPDPVIVIGDRQHDGSKPPQVTRWERPDLCRWLGMEEAEFEAYSDAAHSVDFAAGSGYPLTVVVLSKFGIQVYCRRGPG
jgi:hypothetical protein